MWFCQWITHFCKVLGKTYHFTCICGQFGAVVHFMPTIHSLYSLLCNCRQWPFVTHGFTNKLLRRSNCVIRYGLLFVWYLITATLFGPLEGLPYTPFGTGEADRVVTNLTCAYDFYCPDNTVVETSCDDFGGNALITCLTCEHIHIQVNLIWAIQIFIYIYLSVTFMS